MDRQGDYYRASADFVKRHPNKRIKFTIPVVTFDKSG